MYFLLIFSGIMYEGFIISNIHSLLPWECNRCMIVFFNHSSLNSLKISRKYRIYEGLNHFFKGIKYVYIACRVPV